MPSEDRPSPILQIRMRNDETLLANFKYLRYIPRMKFSGYDAPIRNDFRNHLMSVFQKRATARPLYSFRAFAKSLSTDPATLRKIINGKRALGEKSIRRFAQSLKMSEKELEPFLVTYRTRKKLRTLKVDPLARAYTILTPEEFSRVSRWYHYVILDLLNLPTFQPNAQWISETLNISQNDAEKALETFFEMGWITKWKDGGWKRQIGQTTTSSQPNPVVSKIRHHLITEIAEKCLSALEKFPKEHRHHSAMTIPINSHLLPEAIEKIRAFRIEMADFLSNTKEPDDVYQLMVGLFPATTLKSK